MEREIGDGLSGSVGVVPAGGMDQRMWHCGICEASSQTPVRLHATHASVAAAHQDGERACLDVLGSDLGVCGPKRERRGPEGDVSTRSRANGTRDGLGRHGRLRSHSAVSVSDLRSRDLRRSDRLGADPVDERRLGQSDRTVAVTSSFSLSQSVEDQLEGHLKLAYFKDKWRKFPDWQKRAEQSMEKFYREYVTDAQIAELDISYELSNRPPASSLLPNKPLRAHLRVDEQYSSHGRSTKRRKIESELNEYYRDGLVDLDEIGDWLGLTNEDFLI
ncbi:hypothetical protein B0A49_12051 [Cryomyces minteri]|uniref:Uncharacterized protein n=1 Tax=Cryomyces minteri TaxID=331657 RepID=A0A4U0VYE3_9PEZI|nr:hypothetical protein B0A49_12051 [Cryomyces minteri]